MKFLIASIIIALNLSGVDYCDADLKNYVRNIVDSLNYDVELVEALITIESSWNVKAVSHKGAYGLMQIHCPTWKEFFNLEKCEELFNIELNIIYGIYILKHFEEKCGIYFLRCYNSGNKYSKAGRIFERKVNNILIKLRKRRNYENRYYNAYIRSTQSNSTSY